MILSTDKGWFRRSGDGTCQLFLCWTLCKMRRLSKHPFRWLNRFLQQFSWRSGTRSWHFVFGPNGAMVWWQSVSSLVGTCLRFCKLPCNFIMWNRKELNRYCQQWFCGKSNRLRICKCFWQKVQQLSFWQSRTFIF